MSDSFKSYINTTGSMTSTDSSGKTGELIHMNYAIGNGDYMVTDAGITKFAPIVAVLIILGASKPLSL